LGDSVNNPAMIRAAHPHEIRLLPQIENAADLRFARVGLQLVVDMPGHSIAALERGRRQGLLWVAVSPRGHVVGTALLERCATAARALGHEPLYLTTYRDVAWNKPFYERRGFTEVPHGALNRTLRGVLLLEVSHGHPIWRRAVMQTLLV
jgi:GNAT superfamily N-acetyltransferase